MRVVENEIQLPLLHRKNLNRPVPVLVSYVFSVVSFKQEQLERKSCVRHDHLVLILLLCHTPTLNPSSEKSIDDHSSMLFFCLL